MNAFEYVSTEYVSNCMIEAVKVKLKDPRHVKLYFCKPTRRQMFHFMWSDGKADYDFSDGNHGNVPWYQWYQYLLYRGRIRRFKLGFAARYAKHRNRGHT